MQNKKNQIGTTLLELIFVMGMMGVMATSVVQDKIAENAQLRARSLGGEIATFSRGLASFTGYYAAIDPLTDINSPLDGDMREGVDWLKSNNCDPTLSTATGLSGVGFIPQCSFLSHPTNISRDNKTTFGNLGVETHFKRTTSGTGENILIGTAYFDVLNETYTIGDETGLSPEKIMIAESGIAAIVAGGYNTDALSNNYSSYSVMFCIPSTAGNSNALWQEVCPGNDWKIAVTTAHDAESNSWLRTDGSNYMNNMISWNPGIADELKGISNITNILLADTGGNYTGMEGSLAIGYDVAAPFIRMNEDNIDILRSNLVLTDANLDLYNSSVIVHDGNIGVEYGYISVDYGNIEANAGTVTADELVAATNSRSPVYMPPEPASGVDSGHQVILDGESEMEHVGAQGVYFASNPAGRAGNASVSSITANSDTSMEVRSDKVTYTQNSPAPSGEINRTTLSGTFDVRNFNLIGNDGTKEFALSSVLPRYTHLGSSHVSNTGGYTRIDKSPYEALGCARNDLKILVTPTHVYSNTVFNASTSTSGGTGWRSLYSTTGIPNTGYSIYNPNYFDGIGIHYVDIANYSTYWNVQILSPKTSSGALGATRRGKGVANIYCLNEIAR
ncbi:type II secretion system protein [Vibrio breoganii]